MKFISQNVRSLKSKINVDTIINTMEVNNISAYCIQETWLDGNFIKGINGYIFFHHELVKQTCKRGQKGVGIILSPELTKYYKDTGSIQPVIPKNINSVEFGRFIGIKLKFDIICKEKHAFKKKKKKVKASKLIYIYRPFITHSNSKINRFLMNI